MASVYRRWSIYSPNLTAGNTQVLVAVDVVYLQISGDSSEPSGQSFSPSHRQPLEIQVTWSLHTNCLELQVLGCSSALELGAEKEKQEKKVTVIEYKN